MHTFAFCERHLRGTHPNILSLSSGGKSFQDVSLTTAAVLRAAAAAGGKRTRQYVGRLQMVEENATWER
jgi:hypothetical protein